MLNEFCGSQRHILDYLTEEVLQQQPATVQAFLLRASLLERLSAPLCDALMEQAGSQKILESLEQANLFVVPLDEQRRWYRYHMLFAETLRHRLAQTMGEEIPALHQRASAWYAQQRYTSEAVEHALHAKTWEWAAELIEQALYRHTGAICDHTTQRRWIRQPPTEVVLSRPRLCLAYALAFFWSVPATEIESWLQKAETALMKENDEAEANPASGEQYERMCSEEQKALAALAQAVDLGEPEGYIRSFVDEGSPIRVLLSRLREQKQQCKQAPTPYLESLLAAYPQEEHVQKEHPEGENQNNWLILQQPLLDPLSERELDVLHLLARGASNQEIAEELVVAITTVKHHMSNILSKLGASNRTQALAQAHSLGLLLDSQRPFLSAGSRMLLWKEGKI